MLRNRIVGGLLAAAPRALLTLTVAAALCAGPAGAQTLNSDMQGSPKDAPVVPGLYDTELCVVSIDAATSFVTFMAPNPEDPNAAMAFAFKKVAGFKQGDLVKLKAATSADAGQPTVTVLEAGSAKCKRYGHAHH